MFAVGLGKLGGLARAAEGATTDDPATELGRASLTMGKPSSPVETLKITLSDACGAKGKLLVEWENVTASAPFTVK